MDRRRCAFHRAAWSGSASRSSDSAGAPARSRSGISRSSGKLSGNDEPRRQAPRLAGRDAFRAGQGPYADPAGEADDDGLHRHARQQRDHDLPARDEFFFTAPGLRNLAFEAGVTGYSAKITAETLLAWDPDIIVMNHYDVKQKPSDIYDNPVFSSLKAVKNHRIFKKPLLDPNSHEAPLIWQWMATRRLSRGVRFRPARGGPLLLCRHLRRRADRRPDRRRPQHGCERLEPRLPHHVRELTSTGDVGVHRRRRFSRSRRAIAMTGAASARRGAAAAALSAIADRRVVFWLATRSRVSASRHRVAVHGTLRHRFRPCRRHPAVACLPGRSSSGRRPSRASSISIRLPRVLAACHRRSRPLDRRRGTAGHLPQSARRAGDHRRIGRRRLRRRARDPAVQQSRRDGRLRLRGGMLAMVVVYAISRVGRRSAILMLVLSGVVSGRVLFRPHLAHQVCRRSGQQAAGDRLLADGQLRQRQRPEGAAPVRAGRRQRPAALPPALPHQRAVDRRRGGAGARRAGRPHPLDHPLRGRADLRGGRLGGRHRRLGRPGRAAFRAHDRRARTTRSCCPPRPCSALSTCLPSTMSHARRRRPKYRSGSSPRSSARRSSPSCWCAPRPRDGGNDQGREGRRRLRRPLDLPRRVVRARARRAARNSRPQRPRQDDAAARSARPAAVEQRAIGGRRRDWLRAAGRRGALRLQRARRRADGARATPEDVSASSRDRLRGGARGARPARHARTSRAAGSTRSAAASVSSS